MQDKNKANAGVWKKTRRFFRYIKIRLSRIEAEPQVIARGLAIGVFIGLMPLAPFRTILCLLLAFAFRGSKAASLMGAYIIANPLDIVPHYMLIYYIGRHITGIDIAFINPHKLHMAQIMSEGWDLVAVLMAGGLAVSPVGALAAYFISYKSIVAYRAAKKRKKSVLKSKLNSGQ